jgi:hypothetical protein
MARHKRRDRAGPPPGPAGLLRLQGEAGNDAVVQLISRIRSAHSDAPARLDGARRPAEVQRAGSAPDPATAM